MALLLNATGLKQSYGAVPLFENLSFNVSEGQRLGFIGPNGSGKSTLLEIVGGKREPDAGTVALRKNTRVAYVAQQSEFLPGQTVRSVMDEALRETALSPAEREGRLSETLGRAGFEDFAAVAVSLSGGWRKRLAIARALALSPDLLFLDEPTNHLDIEGIEWLEKLLLNSQFSSVVISHDRYFLENVATEIAELNRIYPEGIFRVSGKYSYFLEKKDEFLVAQNKQQESLQNRVRTEIEWLRRGPKARATKAKARIDKANELIGQLNDLNSRTRTARTDIDFTATDRKTKRLLELKSAGFDIDGRTILRDLNFVMTAGTRAGLVGPNGSGKTTLLRLLREELKPTDGKIVRADNLRIVYFDQNRVLDPEVTLRRALAPHSDSVLYGENTIHVASWAARFAFTSEQLNQPVGRLSGGERARVLIAKLMLEPADLLLLDEPTNDLDIPTLEVLEESLLEFKGALVLVTHDRYMLDRVSTVVWGLDGEGNAGTFADFSQWEDWQDGQKSRSRASVSQASPGKSQTPPPPGRKKLSYLDSRDFDTIEHRISAAEEVLAGKKALLENGEIARDPKRLGEALREIEESQAAVDQLYERWAELEAKIS